MDDVPGQMLAQLIARHGTSLAEDRSRTEALLRDVCGEFRLEIRLLALAHAEDVPRDLIHSTAGIPMNVLLGHLGQRLCDNVGIESDKARWAVETWAIALGLFSAGPQGDTDDGGSDTRDEKPAGRANRRSATSRSEARQSGAPPRTEMQILLETADPGAVVRIPSGTHRLGTGVTISRSLSIVGEGTEETILTADDGEFVLRFTGPGSLDMYGLSLTWTGSGLADVMVVEDAQVEISHCRFFGATVGKDFFGAGLALGKNAQGTIEACQFSGNGYGIVVQKNASVLIDDCDVMTTRKRA